MCHYLQKSNLILVRMYGRDLDRWFMSNIYGMVERYYLVMIDSFLYFFAQTQMPFENSCVLVFIRGI